MRWSRYIRTTMGRRSTVTRNRRTRRLPHRSTRLLAVLAVLTGSTALGLALALSPGGPAFADGPAPCTVGGPPYPFAGFCATYSGANTWYGSYGPGFPTPEGWGFCADPPASGGDYPAPDYGYEPAPAPAGADSSASGALGFAFSEAQALGSWGGQAGQFTADQAAVAGKLLYDAVFWGSPVPAMDPGVLAAYQLLEGWFTQAIGASGPPQLTVALVGGGTSFTGSASVEVSAAFAGTGAAVAGLPVQLTLSGATLDSPTGPAMSVESTDAAGQAVFSVVAPGPGPVSVLVSVPGGLGQEGLLFFAPTAGELGAQSLAAFESPAPTSVQLALTALPTTGTVSILKGGDDETYYPVAGAVFAVMSGTTTLATLVTAADGTTPASGQLPAGDYTVHEETAPPGYGLSPDQPVTVVAGTNTVVSFTGAQEDHVVPGTLSIAKTDAADGTPLAGATFEVAYDPTDAGAFADIGTCTTSASGACAPAGNDGPGELLPGNYEITELTAPPGYAISAPATQDLDLLAGEAATVRFGDPKLVSAVFEKEATGNVNPAELQLGGAVFGVDVGTPGGPSAARCSTDASGSCVTPAVLESGTRYCWSELVAPPGLAGGASGCFTADNTQSDEPITVQDAGTFVAIAVEKVDAANPSVGLPGATFDLFRVSNVSVASAVDLVDAPSPSDQTLVASGTTGAGGTLSFPLQLPGYAYCAQEVQPPPNYLADTTEQCTGVLTGTTTVPPPVTTLSFTDTEQTVTLQVHKYDSADPGTGIPGATYDLYVQGSPPPSGVSASAPPDATQEPGDTWYGRGTTDAQGNLSFTVPAGYAWCVHEAAAPVNYVADDALHCSAVLTTSSPAQAATIAIPETLATVHLSAYKYDTYQPGTVIPGATYELLADGSRPPGTPEDPPAGITVPGGDAFFAEGTTDEQGVLSFAVPAGFSWCLHEITAPPAYQPDPGYHCTAVLTTDTTSAAATVAVPEVPMTGNLPFTGFRAAAVAAVGGTLVLFGAGLVSIAISARGRRRSARRGRVSPEQRPGRSDRLLRSPTGR